MAQRGFSNSAEEVSILSSGVKIEGKIFSEGNVRIDGKVTGDVNVNGNLTLGETSEVLGEAKGKSITLSGKYEGTIRASEKLVLDSKSYLKGDLYAKILVVEEGAKFDGKSIMTDSPTPKIITKPEDGKKSD
jgi:cytoskeletal protein CcmA (bactofilin family)